ncbi:MAG: hypothetical protein AB7H77_07010 [Bdellovibrionales bacterium]
MTPRQTKILIERAAEDELKGYQIAMFTAWNTANFGRFDPKKKLPALQKVMPRAHNEDNKMSRAQIIQHMRGVAQKQNAKVNKGKANG